MDLRLRAKYQHDPNSGIVLDPLSQLIHSILSQRTTSKGTDIAFQNLALKYRKWEDLRDANAHELPSLISTCSWPDKKAERIQAALRQVSGSYPNKLSLDALHYMTDEQASRFLKGLTGVGPKTSAGVLLFSTTRRSALPVDTHYHRITVRLGLLQPTLQMEPAHALLRSRLPATWSADEMERHYIAVKRHGQHICRPRDPKCSSCCLRDLCSYYNRPIQLSLPLFQASFYPKSA